MMYFVLLSGGGAPEMEVACKLREQAQERGGSEQYCWRAFADALELVRNGRGGNSSRRTILVFR